MTFLIWTSGLHQSSIFQKIQRHRPFSSCCLPLPYSWRWSKRHRSAMFKWVYLMDEHVKRKFRWQQRTFDNKVYRRVKTNGATWVRGSVGETKALKSVHFQGIVRADAKYGCCEADLFFLLERTWVAVCYFIDYISDCLDPGVQTSAGRSRGYKRHLEVKSSIDISNQAKKARCHELWCWCTAFRYCDASYCFLLGKILVKGNEELFTYYRIFQWTTTLSTAKTGLTANSKPFHMIHSGTTLS